MPNHYVPGAAYSHWLLAWSLGAWLGGTVGKEIDAMPVAAGRWDTIDAKQRAQYDREVWRFLDSAGVPKDHRARETALVHVPAAAGDGYFRLLTKSPKGQFLAAISAHPRGASAVTLVPVLALKSAAVTAYTAAWASFYAAFPFLRAAQRFPGTRTWALNRAYRLAGGEQTAAELRERYHVEERCARAEESVYRPVPFGAVGVRTERGVYFSREEE
ncbi:hypothetical protein FB451DRAFT_1448537 [Mycena latifolia]|nr:hypothetical protein FB451DRAFT_1448537 [Mycena latifolia]